MIRGPGTAGLFTQWFHVTDVLSQPLHWATGHRRGYKGESEVARTLKSFRLRGMEASTQTALPKERNVIDILKEW